MLLNKSIDVNDLEFSTIYVVFMALLTSQDSEETC